MCPAARSWPPRETGICFFCAMTLIYSSEYSFTKPYSVCVGCGGGGCKCGTEDLGKDRQVAQSHHLSLKFTSYTRNWTQFGVLYESALW